MDVGHSFTRHAECWCTEPPTSELGQRGLRPQNAFGAVGSVDGGLFKLVVLKEFVELLNVLQHHLRFLFLVGVIVLKGAGLRGL